MENADGVVALPVRRSSMKNVILSAPTHVELVITEKCNHKCKHCYNSWRPNNEHRGSISLEKFKRILDELVLNKVNYVTLTGGEPLFEEDILFHIIGELQKNNVGVGLNTNLTLVSKQFLERLINEYKWNNTILTSLPGFTADECDNITQVKGSYEKICNGIAICNDYRIRIGVNVVVKKSMIKRLPNLYEFVKHNRISMLSITRTIPPSYDTNNPEYNFTPSDINEVVDFMRSFQLKTGIRVTSLCSIPLCLIQDTNNYDFLSTKCTAGIISCTINGVNGDVTPCAHNDLNYGNIYADSLQEIWKRMNSWRNGEMIPDECHDCSMLSKCGGDCRLVQARIRQKKYELNKADSTNNTSYKEKSPQYDINSVYLFNHKTIIREEKFGAVVALGVNEFYLKNAAYQIIVQLSQMLIIDRKSVESICNINESLIVFMNNLCKAGIIYPVQEEK